MTARMVTWSNCTVGSEQPGGNGRIGVDFPYPRHESTIESVVALIFATTLRCSCAGQVGT